MQYKIFIIEDDPGIAAAIADLAQSWSLEAHICQDLRHVDAEFAAVNPQLVLLDICLPCFDGYHWCGELRKISRVPIIIVSSAADNMNIVMAMHMGADDFIAKPFDAGVLMAKIQALLRRCYDFDASARALSCRGAFLNTGDHTLRRGGQKIELSKNEYRILLCLMENKGRTVSRERLMQRLWDTDSFIDDNTLTVNVNRLRRKLDGAGLSGLIATKIGVGYCLNEENT